MTAKTAVRPVSEYSLYEPAATRQLGRTGRIIKVLEALDRPSVLICLNSSMADYVRRNRLSAGSQVQVFTVADAIAGRAPVDLPASCDHCVAEGLLRADCPTILWLTRGEEHVAFIKAFRKEATQSDEVEITFGDHSIHADVRIVSTTSSPRAGMQLELGHGRGTEPAIREFYRICGDVALAPHADVKAKINGHVIDLKYLVLTNLSGARATSFEIAAAVVDGCAEAQLRDAMSSPPPPPEESITG